jgi:hypothetical protein
VKGASNRLIDVEDLSEEELHVLHKYYRRLSEIAKKEEDFGKAHSIEEAEHRQATKQAAHKKNNE